MLLRELELEIEVLISQQKQREQGLIGDFAGGRGTRFEHHCCSCKCSCVSNNMLSNIPNLKCSNVTEGINSGDTPTPLHSVPQEPQDPKFSDPATPVTCTISAALGSSHSRIANSAADYASMDSTANARNVDNSIRSNTNRKSSRNQISTKQPNASSWRPENSQAVAKLVAQPFGPTKVPTSFTTACELSGGKHDHPIRAKVFKQPKSNVGYAARKKIDRPCRERQEIDRSCKEERLKSKDAVKHYTGIDEILLEQIAETNSRKIRQQSVQRLKRPKTASSRRTQTEEITKTKNPHTVPKFSELHQQWQHKLRQNKQTLPNTQPQEFFFHTQAVDRTCGHGCYHPPSFKPTINAFVEMPAPEPQPSTQKTTDMTKVVHGKLKKRETERRAEEKSRCDRIEREQCLRERLRPLIAQRDSMLPGKERTALSVKAAKIHDREREAEYKESVQLLRERVEQSTLILEREL